MWFHCTHCDGFSREIPGFDETRHFARCTCGEKMYLNQTGTPEEIGLTVTRNLVKATKEDQR